MLALALTLLAHAGPTVDQIERSLYDNLDVKQCFVPLFEAGEVPTRVEWTFAIREDGSAVLERTTPESLSDEFRACAAEAVAKLAFEAPSEPSTVTFPFVLDRGGPDDAERPDHGPQVGPAPAPPTKAKRGPRKR